MEPPIGGSDPATIADQIAAFEGVDLWGFSEVNANDAMRFEDGAAVGEGANFAGVLGTTGGGDRLLAVYDADRYTLLGSGELGEINVGGNVRASLVLTLEEKATALQFIFMVNHLYRTDDAARHTQATLLNQWAATQTLPVIAVGDYNFDWDVATGTHDMGYDLMVQNGRWEWVKPAALVTTECSGNPCQYNEVLDFVFVAGAAEQWPASSEIVVRAGDFPDNENISDHRPVEAMFSVEVPATATPTLTPTPTSTANTTPIPPSPTPVTLTPTPSVPVPAATYIVAKGDTLYSIARRYGTTVVEIMRVNGLQSDLLYVGQVLSIASPSTTGSPFGPAGYVVHTVVRGDTIFSLARRYGTTVEAIVQANRLTGPDIYVGQILSIPSSSAALAEGVRYTVGRGDTLFSIARHYGITVEELKGGNQLTGDIIYIGQILSIPTTATPATEGVRYTVSGGDTLFSIARSYGTTVEGIKRVNQLHDDVIYVGQILSIPSASATPPL